MIDLCGGCGHSMEGHVSNPCGHDNPDGKRCGCPVGMRADVLLCQQNVQIFAQLNRLNDTMAKLLILVQVATGQKVTFTPGANGKMDVEISPFNPQTTTGSPHIVVPGH